MFSNKIQNKTIITPDCGPQSELGFFMAIAINAGELDKHDGFMDEYKSERESTGVLVHFN